MLQYCLGERGSGLKPWLMTPFANPQIPQEEHFNHIHAHTHLKGTVHPKMKIQSLSSHTDTDGRVGKVFYKTLLVFQREKVCCYLPSN